MHGPRVIGKEAYAAQQALVKQGADKFGPRVRGVSTKAQTAPSSPVAPTGAKVNSPAADAVSVEELRRILGENGTFFDGLYEAELSRADGARPDALTVFLLFETTGQQRPDVLDEIRELLADKGVVLATEGASQFTDGPEVEAPVVSTPQNYDAMTKAQLEEVFAELGGDAEALVGTGADGNVLKVDLLEAVKVLAGQGA